jgi:hypothetical protein
MFRRIRYPIKNIWRNDKRYMGTAYNPGDNEPNNNKLFATIIMCVCVYSLHKHKK